MYEMVFQWEKGEKRGEVTVTGFSVMECLNFMDTEFKEEDGYTITDFNFK